MKVSIFWNNIAYGVDYTNREGCTGVIDISDYEFAEIKAWHKIINPQTMKIEDIEQPIIEEDVDEEEDLDIEDDEE